MNFSKICKLSALALAAAGFSGAAMADSAETKGGLKIKTDDGRFEMSIGGRIQYDYYFVMDDETAAFGSGLSVNDQSAGFFRRARLSFAGKLYGWEYLFVPDFSQNTGAASTPAAPAAGSNGAPTAGVAFQELWFGTEIWGGKLFIGQFKPFRGLEELTSSNELTFLERPYTTASGIYANQFVQGLGYQKVFADMFNVAADVYTPRRDSGGTNGGYGIGYRVAFAPVNTDGAVIHLANSMGYERPVNDIVIGTANARYGGRRGYAAGAFPANTGIATTNGSGNSIFNVAFEAAAVYGPLYFQSEIAHADFEAPGPQPGSSSDPGVLAYHAAASWFVTGESKPYDIKKGVFKSPKPLNTWGAIELVTRYEYMDNEQAASNVVAIQDISNFAVGFNYYVNPNVRFMVNYNIGNANRTDDSKDRPETVGIRSTIYW